MDDMAMTHDEKQELSEMTREDMIVDSKKAAAEEVKVCIKGKTVYRVKIVHSSATEFCVSDDDRIKYEIGDSVVIPTRYGKDLGSILGIITNTEEVADNDVFEIVRKASQKDLKKYEENREKDKKAFELCKQKALEHKLDMKLVSAHYLLDESKILFFFTADARVDFRELVKDLVSIFRTRIELRQIGVRDESRVLGGMGMCGRGFCCNTITDKLNPVSIKMAKEQNLSLNSLKISGACGRLLCCLAYEYPFYNEIKGKLPQTGSKLTVGGKEYYVDEVNIFKKHIVLRYGSDYLEFGFDQFFRDQKTCKWCVKHEACKKKE